MGLALATAATTVTTCKSRQLLLQKIESPRVVQRKIGELRALGDCRRHPGYLASVFRVLSSIMPIPVRQSRSGSLLGTRRHEFQWNAELVHDYVLFMANTGRRPDEAKNLQHRHVTVVQDRDTEERILEIEVRPSASARA